MKRPGAFLAIVLAASSGARAYDLIHFLDPIKLDDRARPVAAAASADRLYVLDGKKGTLSIFDADGKLLKAVDGSGDRRGLLDGPHGAAVGPDGRVYVADTGNHRVAIFDREGRFLSSFGAKGSERGRLKSPRSVAAGADGRVYVADTGNDRVQVFTPDGILLSQIGSSGKQPGQLRSPTRVCVDPSDDVYVLDAGNGRVEKFQVSGHFVAALPLEGDDMAVDGYGSLYLLSGGAAKVTEADSDGRLTGRFGSYGAGNGQFKKAEGIAVAPDGRVIVLDTGNARVSRVELVDRTKKTPLPADPAANLSIVGPTREWTAEAAALAAGGDVLYACSRRGEPLVVFDMGGREKGRFGAVKGKGADVTRGCAGLSIGQKTGLFLSDAPDNRLQRFSMEGRWKANIGETQGFFDSKKQEGRLNQPSGVAVNDDGVVYVADTGNRRIDAFNPDGVFVFSIGPKLGSYDLQEPVGLAWDKAGFLYFTDRGLKKVFKVEPSGALAAEWGSEGDGPGQFRAPSAIAFDGENDLYTLDSRLRRISVHTRDGRWIADFFAGGKGERELEEPTALAVSGSQLFVADAGKGKILSFDLHPRPAAPTEVSTTTKQGVVALSWTPVDDAWVSGYRVFRASSAAGAFSIVGSTSSAKFQDAAVNSESRYWYWVAAVAKTRDVGPWSPAAEVVVGAAFNRAPIEFSTITLGDVFAANYKWYLKNPIGKMLVTNNVNVPFLDVKATFKLKNYMDFGFDTEIKTLGPKQTVEIPLIATLNNKVLEVTEDTPIQAEFALSYFENGEPRLADLTKPLRLYSRNAITWDDPRKLANFITYKDEPVKSFAAASSGDSSNPKAAALNPNVLKAMRIWEALGEYGLKYVVNPANPFETAHDAPNFPVDYAQYPRETLKRKAGQCSDLAALYAALLEDNEIRVALIDYPGHIALMLDTEADDALEAGLPPELLVAHGGAMWLPVETTYVGKPFLEAASKAAEAYKTEEAKGRVRVVDVDDAFREYEPVTMPPSDFAPAPPDAAALAKRGDAGVEALAKERARFLSATYEERLAKDPNDSDSRLQLGIVEAESGSRAEAAADFDKVLALDPKNAAALNNLGHLAFLSGDFAAAERRFEQAAEADGTDGDIWLNLLKAEAKLKKMDKARECGSKVLALSPAYKSYVDGLINGF